MRQAVTGDREVHAAADREGEGDSHRAYRGSARAVVAHCELLHRDSCPSPQLSSEKPRDPVSGIALVGIRLDYYSCIHPGGMVLLVLGGVVGVYGVGHVHRQYE